MLPKLKVLHVLGELKPSGAETMLKSAYAEFFKQGVVAEVLSTGKQVGSFAHNLHQAGYVVHHIPFVKSPLFFIKVFRLMRNNYDVIHLHTERGNFWLGLVALWAAHGRVIRTIHSSFRFEGFLRWRRMVQRRILQSLGLCHVAIGVSVERVENECYGTTPKVVSNWYDSSHFIPPSKQARDKARYELGVPNDLIVMVTVGNCSIVKNHGAAIQALSLLPLRIRPLYLHVGLEEPSQPERLLAIKLGVSDHVRFIGPLTDVRPALYAADIFLMPSLNEGFGIAALEGLACGLPAVLADVTGLCDLKDTFPGLIYCETSAEKLAESLQALLEMDSESRNALALSYPELSQQKFGVKQGVEGYVRLYRNFR